MSEKKVQQKEKVDEEERQGDQEVARQLKMKKLVEEGIDIFPQRARMTHSLHELVEGYSRSSREELEEKKVKATVAGRIISVRRMGRATFFHIIDSRSRLQSYLQEDRVGKKHYELFSLLDIGDIFVTEAAVIQPLHSIVDI